MQALPEKGKASKESIAHQARPQKAGQGEQSSASNNHPASTKKRTKKKSKKAAGTVTADKAKPCGWSQKNVANAHYRSATFFCAQPCIRARARCEKQLSFLSFFLLVQAGQAQ